MAYYLGLDLGGTNIKAGVLDAQARLMAKVSAPTCRERGVEGVADAMADTARHAAQAAGLSLSRIDAVGIGAPGPLSIAQGLIRGAPNFPGWRDVPIRDAIARRLGRPTVLENDANAAAFGEFWAGAGRGSRVRHMVMLTLGTGVGSGIIMDGKVLHGASDLAGEAGHIIVVPGGRPCGCGQRGCVEAYASADSTARRAAEAVAAGEESVLKRNLAAPGGTITAKDVFEAAAAGDALAGRVADETAAYLGTACVTLCRVLDPEMIVFSGGMVQAGDRLIQGIRDAFVRQDWRMVRSEVRIVPAVLGNDAGCIGAAAVAWDARGARLPA